MVDTRFHPYAGPKRLDDLLAGSSCDSRVEEGSGSILIEGAEELDIATAGHVVLASSRHYRDALQKTSASVAIIGNAFRDDVPENTIAVVTKQPQALFTDILEQLYPDATQAIARANAVAETRDLPWLENNIMLASNVHIATGAEIGRGTIIGAGVMIGAGVTIGRDCVIGAGVTIQCAHIGNNVVLHTGTRIGCEGFGWLDHGQTNRKIPQLGRVIIQDHAEIGANSTIDRGALGDTVIGEGTKIDNLVQIGHNCRIGRNCLIAATSGLSGGTILGDGVLMGGGVGTSGHLVIGDGTIVHGRAAVTKDWPAGSRIAGAPAQDIKDFWRELAHLRQLGKGE